MPQSTIDYEALVTTFCAKDMKIEKLSEKKRVAIKQSQETIQKFLQVQYKLQNVRHKSQLSNLTLKEEKDALKNVQDDKGAWDKIFAAKQQQVEETKQMITKNM